MTTTKSLRKLILVLIEAGIDPHRHAVLEDYVFLLQVTQDWTE